MFWLVQVKTLSPFCCASNPETGYALWKPVCAFFWCSAHLTGIQAIHFSDHPPTHRNSR